MIKIIKDNSTEKAVHEVVNLKYNNYISELKDRIVQIIKENDRILITAPTGGGKTFTTIEIMKSFDDRLNIILTPCVIQNKQNASSYSVQAFTGNEKNIRNKYISATYDKARTIINYVKENGYKFNLFIDECHLLVDASGYRSRAINDVLELAKMADKVVYMSATNGYMRNLLQYDIELNIEPVEKRNNIANAQILLLDPENIESSLLHEIYEASKLNNGRKTVLFLDDIKKLQEFKSILTSKGFKDNQIAVISSKEKTDYDQEVYSYIISHSQISEQTKIILTTSILEVGTNIDTKNVNIFVYIPKPNHLSLNKIAQQVARFRVKAGETSNNLLKICLPYREREDNHITPFNKTEKDSETEGDKIVNGITSFIDTVRSGYSKEMKNKEITNLLAEPKSAFELSTPTSLGFIELDEENSVPVINKFKLRRIAKEKYESQFFYNVPELEEKLKSMLSVEYWFDTVHIKSEDFKEELEKNKQAASDERKDKKERVKEIFKKVKKESLDNFFVEKVIDPDLDVQIEFIDKVYEELKDTNILRLTREADKMGIEPQDIINSFIENGDSEVKNNRQFKACKFAELNNEYPIGEEIPKLEIRKIKPEYIICRKYFDDVCKKRGKITQSKENSFLLELVKHSLLKDTRYEYSIRGADQLCKNKKNDLDKKSKPLSKKEIDKLAMSTITLIYNTAVSKDNKTLISSLKK